MTASNKAEVYTDVLFSNLTWTCDNPQQNSRRGLSVLLWKDEKRLEKPKIQLARPDEPFPTVKGLTAPSSQESPWFRLLLTLPTEEQKRFMQQLDAFAVDLASRKCREWFGKTLSTGEIQAMYRPLLQTEDSPLKLHVNRDQCNVWALHAKNLYTASTFSSLSAGSNLLPCVTVNGMYFKAREMGLSLSCTDILVCPSETFPFTLNKHLSRADKNEAMDELPEHSLTGTPLDEPFDSHYDMTMTKAEVEPGNATPAHVAIATLA